MPRHTSPRFWIALAVSALGVVALDQMTKAWVLAHRAVLETARPTIGLTLVWNEAVAFSLPLRGPWVYLVAAAVLLIVVPTIARALDRTKAAGGMLLGFLLGGAAGNLIDRVRFDAVVDFVKVGWWPVFNVADAAISTSIVVLILFGKFLFVPERSPVRATKLGFDERLLPLVLAGTKTVTFRRGARFAELRSGTELGAEHTQRERIIGRLTITSVREVRFGDISHRTPGHEPYADHEEMRQDFQQWYPDLEITDDTLFWEIRFKLTSIDAHALQELEAHPLLH